MILSMEEAEKHQEHNEIKVLETTIWQDVFRARRSLAILEIFIQDLEQCSSQKSRDKNAPMVNALWSAAADSVIISLGRLLNSNAGAEECSLAVYRARVIQYLMKHGPVLNESFHAKDNLVQLQDIAFVRELKKRQEHYEKILMPWRNTITAHSIIGSKAAFPKNLSQMVQYVEDVHRICYSAMEDTGGPGLYSVDHFKTVSGEWCKLLSI